MGNFISDQKDNVYTIDVEKFSTQDKYFSILKDDYWLWYRRHGHAIMSTILTLSKKNLIEGLPSLIFQKDQVCDAS